MVHHILDVKHMFMSQFKEQVAALYDIPGFVKQQIVQEVYETFDVTKAVYGAVANKDVGDALQPQSKLLRRFPALNQRIHRCPGCNPGADDTHDAPSWYDRLVWDLIQHLNDFHKWTREEIADWLESTDLDLTLKGEDQ
jgi:hypothetical protein